MHKHRPSRAPGFSYVGPHRYLVTICTVRTTAALTQADVVEFLLWQLRQQVAVQEFALVAYSFMPTHVHLLLKGLTEFSDLRKLVARWKQYTGYQYKRRTGSSLWMSGYHDRVLHDEDGDWSVLAYVMMNAVRAGLVSALGEHPFTGSDVYGKEELVEGVREWLNRSPKGPRRPVNPDGRPR